jgi:DNA-binding beta-propeller fold protein YncE
MATTRIGSSGSGKIHRDGALTLSLALAATVTAACGGASAGGGTGAPTPQGVYEAWVTSEAVDQIALIRFDGTAAEVVRTRTVGSMPVEVDGPHGVAVSPDGRFLFVTLGHGLPYGTLLKIDTETDQVVGRTTLGLFPATVSLTPDGEYGFVSNFNLHGDHVPSSISMVHLPSMTEVARTETCVMPHGSRVDPTGTRHYSVCMMDELLVELDASTAQIRRSFSLRPGAEGPVEGTLPAGAAHDHAVAEAVCSPTWAEPAADGSRVFVACNRAAEILEISVGGWEVVRRFETGESPYNIAVTPDGRLLLVTLRNRADAALEVHDLATGALSARVPLSTSLGHGVAVSDDSRIAFVSVEGVGAEPGRVDVIDLAAGRRVASVDVGQQATGVAVVPGSR